jgi:hypothetical protein
MAISTSVRPLKAITSRQPDRPCLLEWRTLPVALITVRRILTGVVSSTTVSTDLVYMFGRITGTRYNEDYFELDCVTDVNLAPVLSNRRVGTKCPWVFKRYGMRLLGRPDDLQQALHGFRRVQWSKQPASIRRIPGARFSGGNRQGDRASAQRQHISLFRPARRTKSSG